MSISRDKVLEYLSFDESTGRFHLRRKTNRWPAGWAIGTTDTRGHLQIAIEGKLYLAHRLAWLVTHGYWPEAGIDHIDGDKQNNRTNNLRLCNQSQNCANSKMPKTNTVGLKGVTRHGTRFRAQICVNRKKMHIGVYATAEEAHDAYVRTAKEFFGEFARAS